MPKSVIILGSGPSLALYKYKEGDIVWCPFSMFSEETKDKVSLFFGMHDFETGKHEGMIDLTNYPLSEITESFGSRYFNNSCSYMIAYALHTGVSEIDFFGVDMNGEDEYYSQRGSVMYWIGYARAKGIKVNMASQIDTPLFLYGYEKSKPLKNKIAILERWAMTEKNSESNPEKVNQYIGFIHALNMLKKEI